MGLEAIGSIGTAIGSVASGIGKAGAGAAPATASFDGLKGFGGLEGLAPAGLGALPDVGGIAGSLSEFKASVPIASFDTGSVRGGFLEGFKPMDAFDITTVNTGGTTAPSEFNTANVVAEAVGILPQAKIPQPEVMPAPAWEVFAPIVAPLKAPNIVEFPKPGITVSPALEPATGTQTKTENSISVLPQPVLEEKMEEIVEEKREKQEPKEVLEEEEAKERKIIVEDREVTAQRKLDIKAAIKKAKELIGQLGWKKITGILIAKFAPKEYAGVRSQLIKEQGPDGSYQETVEEIAGAGEFESVKTAQEKVDQVIAEKKPGKWGNNGIQLAFGHIARIFKYRILKPVQAYTEVVTRVVKKKVSVAQQTATPAVASEKKEVKAETNLEELSPALAEVFQKAA